ncbi:hypothetical protein KND94_001966 [Staphylococcus pseudintermedius]|uniref:hypothetical protein n=1 Tax=Staphylococcus pseudintermedius TaxID=283734 RepID=UPI0019F8A5A8|nr:hypothetical protein [Staphylococcus pseudintermedius]HEC2174152.1 hypothetical protein [Staphylococcus delphini]EGQ3392007.1 hypothetical protein [Staphylococcus pseudintermedius]EGQ3597049.1 hypothetical protein [Staphylococcus pseudintermedius]EGQ4238839.1 hypothetical protein [Staphylococcus pseudintermedius]EHP0490875.1 hypothetical protein [Staphylococcus pseudintermedius]
METTSINIRNVSKGLHLRLKQEAKDNGMKLNEYLLQILEANDPFERYRKLYEEQTHQQAQNTKVLQELVSKQDEILSILNFVDY